MKLSDSSGRVVIVIRRREISDGTFQSILRQAGLTREEFEELAD